MCGCNKKINGMSKKIRGFGSIGNAVSDLLPVLAGFAVGQIATKQLTFLSSNPGTSNMLKLAAGLFFASSKGFVGGMAKGVALQGAAGLAMPVLESSGLGLLPPGVPARYIAGIPEPDELKSSQPVGF